MIIVKLICGLGNQLFQYAAARRISYANDIPLKIDISAFETYKLHKYSLKPFNIIEEIATSEDLEKVKYKDGIVGKLQRLSAKFFPYYWRSIIQEQFFHFDPNILKVSGSHYLEGYWQSECYFKEIEDIIHREFTIKIKPDTANEHTLALINSVNAVSVHIRGGDYALNKSTNQFHGTCPLAYYQQAVEFISQKVSSPHFFIFSDDIVWSKKNLVIKHPVLFVSHNDAARNFEDLRLMTQCKHNIIANSTFSWWGAWLNNNPGKIVIAPKRWFNDMSINTKDLIPEDWIRI